MAVTKEELQDFSRFAGDQIENGGGDSLVELAVQWEARCRARRENVAGNCDRVSNLDVATLKQLVDTFPDVDDEFQLRRSLARHTGITTVELLSKAVAAEKAARQ